MTFESQGMRGGASGIARRSAASSAAIGCIMGEWKAWSACSRRQGTSSSASRSASAATASGGPDTTDDRRAVDGGEGELGGEPRPGLLRRQRHGEQGSRRELADEPGAPGDQGQGVGELHHPGETGRRVLPQAVAQEGRRLHPPAHPQPGQAIAHGEHRRLRDAGRPEEGPLPLPWPLPAIPAIPAAPAAQEGAQVGARGGGVLGGLGGLGGLFRSGEQHLTEVEPEVGEEQLGTAVELPPEHRLVPVEAPGQAGILVTHPRQQEGHAAAPRQLLPGGAGPDLPRIAAQEGRRRRLGGSREHRAAIGERPPAHPQGMGDVREIEVRVPLQAGGEGVRHPLEGRGRARRQEQHLPGARGA